MNAFVLALAGLAAGDVGTQAAATAPAYPAPSFVEPFEGNLQFGTLGAFPMEYARGMLTIHTGRVVVSAPCTITADGPGWARVRWGGSTFRCRYRLHNGRLDLAPAGSAQRLWHDNLKSYRLEINVKIG
jgi:hypothetical protein